MNLRAPPITDNTEINEWLDELYEYLKYPHFHQIRFIERATPSESEEGTVYYDSDDNKLKCHNGTDFEDLY